MANEVRALIASFDIAAQVFPRAALQRPEPHQIVSKLFTEVANEALD